MWFCAIGLALWASSLQARLRPLDSKAMRGVSGQAGLDVDISGEGTLNNLQYRDDNGVAGGAGEGVLRVGDGPSVIKWSDGGSSLNLQGFSVNSDDGAIFAALPDGSIDLSLPDITTASTFSSPDRTTHFGSMNINGLNFQSGNVLSFRGQGDGVSLSGDMDNPVRIDKIQWTDPDGVNGDVGTVSFGDVYLEDTRFSAYSFESLGLHVDEAGIVLAAPAAMNDVGVDMNLQINGKTAFGAIIGRSSSGIHFEGSRLRLDGRADGMELTPTIKVDNIDGLRLRDPDGISGTAQFVNARNIQVGDIFGVAGVDPARPGPHRVDVDAGRGIVVRAPARTTAITPLDLAMGSVTVNDDLDDMFALDFSNVDWRGSVLELQPGGTNGDGLTINTDLYLTLNEIRLIDPGLGGFISLGETGAGNGIIVNDGSGGPAELTGMTVDVDGSSGLNVRAPSGPFSVEVTSAHIGDASTSIGSFQANNLNAGGSVFRVQPH